MSRTVMPKATAVWLIDNTTLTFEQIADFCGMHSLEVQAIADGEVAVHIVGENPITTGQLSKEEIARCEANPKEKLQALKSDMPEVSRKVKGPRYTPVMKRADKPDAIAWVIKHHPEVPDSGICKLIGTTKPTIDAVRKKTHWNSPNISPQNPVQLGLCSLMDLQNFLAKYKKNIPAEAADSESLDVNLETTGFGVKKSDEFAGSIDDAEEFEDRSDDFDFHSNNESR